MNSKGVIEGGEGRRSLLLDAVAGTQRSTRHNDEVSLLPCSHIVCFPSMFSDISGPCTSKEVFLRLKSHFGALLTGLFLDRVLLQLSSYQESGQSLQGNWGGANKRGSLHDAILPSGTKQP